MHLGRGPKWLQVACLAVAASLVGAGAFALADGVLGEPAFPAVGVGLSGHLPVVYFKLCKGRSVGRVVLGRVTPGAPPYRAGPAWSAALSDPTRARSDIPIGPAIPGYRVSSVLPDGTLQPGVTYAVIAATDEHGTNIVQSVLTFRESQLRENFIVTDSRTTTISRWLGPAGPGCH